MLTTPHLIAEHREIKRIPNALKKYGKQLNIKNIPTNFKMGEGHVRFFYNKGKYTFDRYIELYVECRRRGIKATDFSGAWDVYKDRVELFNNYSPTLEDTVVIKKILIERDPVYKDLFIL